MELGAIVFMGIAWVFVLGLTFWSWARLLKTPPGSEHPPPPGTSL